MTWQEKGLLKKETRPRLVLNAQQLEVVDEYHANNMAKLRKICDPIIFRKGVPKKDWEDLYDIASDTLLESLISYDDSKGCQFKTYFMGNLKRSFYDWTRDRHRFKRCNLTEERDKNGNPVKDKNGKQKYVVIPDISIDAPTEEGIDLCEKIASSFDIETELDEEIGISSGSKMERYLKQLSKIQKEVAIYLSEGYKPPEIRELLHITEKEYGDCMMAIRSYKNTKILL